MKSTVAKSGDQNGVLDIVHSCHSLPSTLKLTPPSSPSRQHSRASPAQSQTTSRRPPAAPARGNAGRSSAVKIVSTSWHDIPRLPYGLVFVDSSSGRPTPGRGLFRHEATACALQLARRDAVFILHDVNLRRKGYQMSIQTLTDAGLKNVARFQGRTGVGIYRRESDLM